MNFLYRAGIVVAVSLHAAVATAGTYGDAQRAFDNRDFATALRLFRRSAEQGNVHAKGMLGMMYEIGMGVPQDEAKAGEWFRKAAEKGDLFSQYKVGTAYLFGKYGVSRDGAKAEAWFLRAAEHGFGLAQDALALIYFEGRGVPRDYFKAESWASKAAEQGYEWSERILGDLYYMGEGGKQKSYYEAADWYRKAATQDNREAQHQLGVMYQNGEGVPQDYAIAHMWFNLAAALGDEEAGPLRDQLSRKMSPDQVAKAQEMARQWKPKFNLGGPPVEPDSD